MCGYGMMKWKGKQRVVHRWAWIVANGPIPEGLVVCHKCDVRACLNPDHLFVGTHADNAHDRDAKGRTARGEILIAAAKRRRPVYGTMLSNAKLTNEEAVAIRAAVGTNKDVAKAFGVSATLVSYVRNRKAWKHV